MKPPIKSNKKLLWDYDYEIKEEELLREDVLIFYISRVLNNGNLKDVSSIPEELIKSISQNSILPVRSENSGNGF